MRAIHDSSREVRIERAGKILFPKGGITKGELKSVQLRKKGGTIRHVVCNDVSSLVYLANQACGTLHAWLNRADQPEVPQECIIDIDPSGEDVASAVPAALEMRDVLVELGATAYAKATSARGLHVHVPLVRDSSCDSVRSLAKELADLLVTKDPERYTLEASKQKGRGRVYLDVNRNAYSQTAIAPYSVRARLGAPLAVPVDWSELRHQDFRSDGVTLRTAFDYLKDRDDPWNDFGRRAVSVDATRRKLEDWKTQWQHTRRRGHFRQVIHQPIPSRGTSVPIAGKPLGGREAA